MLAIRGADSAIAKHVIDLVPNIAACRIDRGIKPELIRADRFLFCAGLLRPKPIADQTAEEIGETFMVNAGQIIADCDRLFAVNEKARVCIIGSESGFSWSFDGAYAAAKAALHRYVETKKLFSPEQQLVCIAPGIILDAGMTERRLDRDNLMRRAAAHPKGRFLTSIEVAKLVIHCLYVDEGYLSGIVIRLNGGEHACR